MSSLSSKAFFTLLILLASSFQSAYSLPLIKPNVNAIYIATTQGLRAPRPYMHPLSKPIGSFNELQARTDSHSGHESDSESGSSSGAVQQNHAVHHPASQEAPAHHPTAHQVPAHYPTAQQVPASYPTAQQAPAHHPPAQHQPAQQPPVQQPKLNPKAQWVRPKPKRAQTWALGNQITHNSAPTASTSNLNQHGGTSAPSGAQAIAPQQQQGSQAHSGSTGPSNSALPANLHRFMLPAPDFDVPPPDLPHSSPDGPSRIALPANLHRLTLTTPNSIVPPAGLPQGVPPVSQYYQGVQATNQVGHLRDLPPIRNPGPYQPQMGAPQHGQPGQIAYVPAHPPMQVPHRQFVPDLGYWYAFGPSQQLGPGAAHPVRLEFDQEQHPPNNNDGRSPSPSQGHSGHTG